jgi:DNA-binding LacI/PurR family transcriptional regulator
MTGEGCSSGKDRDHGSTNRDGTQGKMWALTFLAGDLLESAVGFDRLMKYGIRGLFRSATLDDVAARCGVSYQTVSRVANGSPLVADVTRARVLEAIAELNYRPNLAARRLATQRSSLIGMVGTRVTYYGPAQVMISVEESAKRLGYNLMFVALERSSDPELRAAIEALCEHQVDGLVIAVRARGRIDLIRKLCRQVPFVTLGSGTPADVPTVVVDERHGVRLATRHLIELGHNRIACIGGPSGWPASRDRRQAWGQTIRSAGLRPGPCVEGDWSAESGYEATISLLKTAFGQFTAIMAGNDHMALGALRALHEKGLHVPGEISVIGYDDLPESRFFEPPLTTVHHDFAWEGQRCVEMLFRAINRESIEPAHQVQRTGLVIRESTAAPRR